MPNSRTAGIPARVGLAGLLDRVRDRQPLDAGHRLDRGALVDPVLDEHRVDEVLRRELGLAHHVPQDPVLRSRRRRVAGKAIPRKVYGGSVSPDEPLGKSPQREPGDGTEAERQGEQVQNRDE